MKKYFTIAFLVLLFNVCVNAQPQFLNFISYLNSLNDSLKSIKIDSLINYHYPRGIPIIESNYAVFIYRGSASTVAVAGDFNNWGSTSTVNVTGTNFFYYSRTFEMNARLDYKFILNGSNWILDPLNPRTCAGGYGPNSELAMPEYIQPWEINYKPGIQHGTTTQFNFQSTNTASTFLVTVYLPPGYASDTNKIYSTAYFQDGSEYISLAYANNIFDNLIDSGKIRPAIGIFVRPNNRNNEYAGSLRDAYRLFFVNELVPFIDSSYRTRKTPQERLVVGDSYGANISALISYNHADVFGNCGLHSAAFQPNNYEAYNLIINGQYKNIKWVSVWGTYESLWQNMRNFRDNLINKGYQFLWRELPEGHSWGLWRANIDFILEYIFPPEPAIVVDKNLLDEKDFHLCQNYPNPFNPATIIKYKITNTVFVSLKVYDLLGKELAILVNEEKKQGIYQTEFNAAKLPAGIYLCRLQAGKSNQTMKLMLIK